MAHPMRKSSKEGQSAKLKRMTSDYGLGSGPANNKLAPPNSFTGDPDAAVGFGADSSGPPRGRADKAGRQSVANPIPTYAKGGAAKRAAGGRTKAKKGATNVNVIVAPQGAAAPPPMPPIVAPPAGGPPGPKPPMGDGPMAPPGVPPGAAGLPMAPGAPGGMPPGLIPPRAKGGRVRHHMTAGAATGEGRLQKIGKG